MPSVPSGTFSHRHPGRKPGVPLTPTLKDDQIVRGGGWDNLSASWVRASIRFGYVPVDRHGDLGFRCILVCRSTR